MHTEIFLREFAPLASGPDGVKKLRELVLQSAVQGKLVPQVSGEVFSESELQTASEFIRQIRGSRFKHIKISRASKELPMGWIPTPLGNVIELVNGRAFKPSDWTKDGLKIVRIQNLNNPSAQFNRYNGEVRERFLIDDGNLLVSWSGTPGTSFGAFIWRGGKAILNQHIFRADFSEAALHTPYIRLAVDAIMNDLISDAVGAAGLKHVRRGQIEQSLLCLPPFAEQKRIVAKVDELMALCDELELQQAEETKLKRATAASAIHQLTEAKAPQETIDHWSLLSSRFGELFDDQVTLKALRATIRILGVQGKLGTQVQSDEPTAALLDRVGRLPPPARYTKRSTEQIPGSCGLSINLPSLPVPSSWDWVPLVEVARIESGHTPSRSRPEWWGGDVPWMGLVDARHHDEGIINDTIQKTNPDGIENSAARILPAGTVCFSRTASVGYVVIMGKPMATSQDFVNWVPTDAVTSEWLQLVMVAERGSIDKFSKGAVHQTIYYPAWLSMHIALPPLAEQKRIVAKVDELMSLCDRLEDQVQESKRLNAELMASLVHALTETDPDGGGAVKTVGLSMDAPETALTEQVDMVESETPEPKGVLLSLNLKPEAKVTADRTPSVDTKFQEAVLVAAIVDTFFQAGGEPIGNFRLQKAVYFARRRMGEHVDEMAYLKKAAGPYNPSMKYSGGIAIAKQKNWLREARGRFGFGHVPGEDLGEAGEWIDTYGYYDPARWVTEHFRYKKNEEWETLATVDYAIEHLQAHGIEPAAEQILQYIASDPEWCPKIEKLRLTEMSVGSAMLEVQALLNPQVEDGVA